MDDLSDYDFEMVGQDARPVTKANLPEFTQSFARMKLIEARREPLQVSC